MNNNINNNNRANNNQNPSRHNRDDSPIAHRTRSRTRARDLEDTTINQINIRPRVERRNALDLSHTDFLEESQRLQQRLQQQSQQELQQNLQNFHNLLFQAQPLQIQRRSESPTSVIDFKP